MLFRGFILWQEEVENSDSDSKPGQGSTSADKREFEDFASNVN